jgi:hypothetical protein
MKTIACLVLCATAAFCAPKSQLVSEHTLLQIAHSSYGMILEVAYNDAKHQLAYYDDPPCDPNDANCTDPDPDHGPSFPPGPGDDPTTCPYWYCCLFGNWCSGNGDAGLVPDHGWQRPLDFVSKKEVMKNGHYY